MRCCPTAIHHLAGRGFTWRKCNVFQCPMLQCMTHACGCALHADLMYVSHGGVVTCANARPANTLLWLCTSCGLDIRGVCVRAPQELQWSSEANELRSQLAALQHTLSSKTDALETALGGLQ
jgi:hypothetical protein